MPLKLVLIVGVVGISIILWVAHRKGVIPETRFWATRWPFLHRDEDPGWFYLYLSVGWLMLIVWLLALIGVFINESGINVPDLLFQTRPI